MYYLYYLQQNPLKLAYEIVQMEHESIDCQYSKEMHILVNRMLQKVQFVFLSVYSKLNITSHLCDTRVKVGSEVNPVFEIGLTGNSLMHCFA